MFCIHCGANNEDGNKFCTSCGKVLEDNIAAVKDESLNQPINETQFSSESKTQTVPDAMQSGAENGFIASNVQPNQPPQQDFVNNQNFNNNFGQQNNQFASYPNGCAGQAWQDIKNGGNWFGRALLLFLIALVPVLNFCSIGYGYSLSRHAILNNATPLPKKIINGENFKWGFFTIIVSLCSYLVLSIITVAPTVLFFFVFPPMGFVWIAVDVVVVVFGGMFVQIMCQRACLISLGAAFHLGKVWKTYTSKFGSLFALNFLPGLLFGLIGAGLSFTIVCPWACWGLNLMTVGRGFGIYILRFCPNFATEVHNAFSGDWSTAKPTPQAWTNNPMQQNAANPTASLTQNNPKPQAGQTFGAARTNDTSQPNTNVNPVPAPERIKVEEKNMGDDGGTTILSVKEIKLKASDKKNYTISSFPAVVGKGSKADCVIKGDSSVSREHVKIHEYGVDKFVIEDLHASNKTYLNGDVLAPEELVVLNDGDTIKMGKTELKITINL